MLKNKKGSFIVVVTLIFLSLIIFMSAIIKTTSDFAISSSVDSLGNLYSTNVLSEYNIDLKNRYGIMAVSLNEYTLEEKLNYYFNYTFQDKKYIKIGDINCVFSNNELADGNIFLEKVKEINGYNINPIIDVNKTDVTDFEDINRVINAKWIINSLPSKKENIELDETLIDDVSITWYLFRFFKDYVNERDLGETYFNNEIEYVLSGELNDSKAKNDVYIKLLVLRNANNLTYLYSSNEKREAVMAISVLISPEFSSAVEALILEAWALLESKNDIALLYDKKSVPLLKDDDSWALSLETALSNIFDGKNKDYETLKDFDYDKEYSNVIEPKVIKGIYYDDYLKSLLMSMNKKTLVYRTMDLIQINMKYLYDGSFLFSDYVTGFNYEIEVNNKEYYFEASY